MLVMENGAREGQDLNVKRAFSAEPGKQPKYMMMRTSSNSKIDSISFHVIEVDSNQVVAVNLEV